MDQALRALWVAYLEAERADDRHMRVAALERVLAAANTPESRESLATTALRALELKRLTTLRRPLHAAVVLPYLQAHVLEPQAIWWMLTVASDSATYEALERYAAHDPLAEYEDDGHGDRYVGACTYALSLSGEPRWWGRLLRDRVDRVSWGTHHLDEGHGLADGSDRLYLVQMCAAVAVSTQAPPGTLAADDLAEMAEEWQLLRDWFRYKAAGRPGSFPGGAATTAARTGSPGKPPADRITQRGGPVRRDRARHFVAGELSDPAGRLLPCRRMRVPGPGRAWTWPRST